MISEGSCGTEDWSNDAISSPLHHRNKLHFKIYSNRKQSFKNAIIFPHFFTVFFDQINVAFASIRDFQKH